MKKAKNHRKRHLPPGPCGMWLQSHQHSHPNAAVNGSGLKKRSHTNESSASKNSGSIDENPGEDGPSTDQFSQQQHGWDNDDDDDYDDDNPNNKTSPTEDASFSPAWTRMQCSLNIVLPYLPPTWNTAQDAARRYKILRPHLSQEYALLWEVASGRHDFKLEEHMKLPVLVHSLVTQTNIWTVRLQDDSGFPLQGWIEPDFVRSQLQASPDQNIIRPGVVWMLRKVSVMMVRNETDELIERMLLISQKSVEKYWTPEEAQQMLETGQPSQDHHISEGSSISPLSPPDGHEREYLEWMEKRRGLVVDSDIREATQYEDAMVGVSSQGESGESDDDESDEERSARASTGGTIEPEMHQLSTSQVDIPSRSQVAPPASSSQLPSISGLSQMSRPPQIVVRTETSQSTLPVNPYSQLSQIPMQRASAASQLSHSPNRLNMHSSQATDSSAACRKAIEPTRNGVVQSQGGRRSQTPKFDNTNRQLSFSISQTSLKNNGPSQPFRSRSSRPMNKLAWSQTSSRRSGQNGHNQRAGSQLSQTTITQHKMFVPSLPSQSPTEKSQPHEVPQRQSFLQQFSAQPASQSSNEKMKRKSPPGSSAPRKPSPSQPPGSPEPTNMPKSSTGSQIHNNTTPQSNSSSTSIFCSGASSERTTQEVSNFWGQVDDSFIDTLEEDDDDPAPHNRFIVQAQHVDPQEGMITNQQQQQNNKRPNTDLENTAPPMSKPLSNKVQDETEHQQPSLFSVATTMEGMDMSFLDDDDD